jgi:hypothetical protein
LINPERIEEGAMTVSPVSAQPAALGAPSNCRAGTAPAQHISMLFLSSVAKGFLVALAVLLGPAVNAANWDCTVKATYSVTIDGGLKSTVGRLSSAPRPGSQITYDEATALVRFTPKGRVVSHSVV